MRAKPSITRIWPGRAPVTAEVLLSFRENMPMPENLTISDRGEYVLTEFSGTFSVDEGKRCIDAMTAAARDTHRPKALFDCREMTGPLPIGARFAVAEYAAITRGVISKIAMVAREDVVLPDNFVENVAVNRGVNLRIFTDYDAAERWLLE